MITHSRTAAPAFEFWIFFRHLPQASAAIEGERAWKNRATIIAHATATPACIHQMAMKFGTIPVGGVQGHVVKYLGRRGGEGGAYAEEDDAEKCLRGGIRDGKTNHDEEERGESGGFGIDKEQDAGRETNDRQGFFGVEKPVGEPAADDGGGDAAECSAESQHPTGLAGDESKAVIQARGVEIVWQVGIPHAAHGIFEEHHDDAEADLDGAGVDIQCHAKAPTVARDQAAGLISADNDNGRNCNVDDDCKREPCKYRSASGFKTSGKRQAKRQDEQRQC